MVGPIGLLREVSCWGYSRLNPTRSQMGKNPSDIVHAGHPRVPEAKSRVQKGPQQVWTGEWPPNFFLTLLQFIFLYI